ncbi:DNA/RNA non-specific endonuclease [Desulfogranum marinum]|uniref:DNA/RNA non-specific endonuclease n=1 Tax=Desulfogranum marinum TaxID=453220 RepID=UPI001964463E|nr:DNA/RNA non-specific endonuclease [Desulfogranum marinum]MBM9512841.1 DNA/RNA non-specific endonuclease [Desulfogranum marinum]
MSRKKNENAPLASLLADEEVVSELQDKVESLQGMLEDLMESPTFRAGMDVLLQASDRERIDLLLDGKEGVPTGFASPEAIVLATGRPALLIRDGQWEEPELQVIKKRIEPATGYLRQAIPKVGRVELVNDPTLEYVGTGWMIEEDVMITNRHVANVFAYHANNQIVLRTTPFGVQLGVQVDFNEEYASPNPAFEVEVVDVVFIEKEGPERPDMALIRLEKVEGLPQPIELSSLHLQRNDDVAVIGYPAKDGGRNDPFIMQRIFKNIYNVKRLSPGRVTGVREDRFILTHDCTTLGGNSGSVVVNLKDGKAAGLHFAGSYKENNFAVTSETIKSKLADLYGRSVIQLSVSGTEERKPTLADLEIRKGYDPLFLGETVDFPEVDPAVVAPVNNREDGYLHYLHFSVVMHKSRRLALFTACNIDGRKLYKIPRRRDRWGLDPRMEEIYQVGNELYKNNPLDRGHMVRRLDPAWGDTREEAAQAADDTFFYTNAHPQHAQLNQRSWLDLEEYILDNAATHDLKVSVFTGPVFGLCDREYRDVLIPQEYWKVVVCINAFTGQLSATAYLLSQSGFMEDLEFVFGAYQTYQVPVQLVENRVGVGFGQLAMHDPLGMVEHRGHRVVNGPDDITI